MEKEITGTNAVWDTNGIKVKSVFFRLIVSYVGLIFLIAITMAFASYIFFQAKYNTELENLHSVLIKNMEGDIETGVVNVAKSLYMDIATQLITPSEDFFGTDDEERNNAVKLYFTYKYLTGSVARNADTVESVHIYYPRAGLVVSSSRGLQLDDPRDPSPHGDAVLKLLTEKGKKFLWSVTESSGSLSPPAAKSSISVHRTFPILSDNSSVAALIGIDFKKSAFRDIVARFSEADAGVTYVFDEKGGLVFESGSHLNPGNGSDSGGRTAETSGTERDNARIEKIHAAAVKINPVPGSLILDIDAVPSLISATEISDTGWVLANVTPLSLLYRKGENIPLVLLLIGLGAVAMGFIAAVFLSSGIYNPLGRLIARVRGLFSATLPPDKTANEYQFLNQAIDGLSLKMEELTGTIETNRPLVKQELVARLLDGDLPDGAVFEETLRSLDIGPIPGPCIAAKLTIVENDIDPEKARALKHRLAETFEQESAVFTMACTLPGMKLGLIAAGADKESIIETGYSWVRMAADKYDLRLSVSFGTPVSSVFELGKSWEEADALSAYRFFEPETSVFAFRPDLLEREKRGGDLPEGLPGGLSKALHLRNRDKIYELFEALVAFVRSDAASADRCMHELGKIVAIVVDYAGECRLPESPGFRNTLENTLTESPDIHACVETLTAVVLDLFARVENKPEDRNGILVERVKKYMSEHIGGELSLDRVSEAVNISPGYLSTIFKDITGTNFVNYIRDFRIVEAEKLLLNSNATVQDICRKVGFNTPAYFIHHFRARYGQTPVDYRRTRKTNVSGS